MKAVIQKSGKASVKVNNEIISEIESGLVILLGISENDADDEINYIVNKIINLRLFEEQGKFFEKSVLEKKKEILLVSQFTLYAECKKGRRPDFNKAAKSKIAEPIYNNIISKLKEKGISVKTGKFGEEMEISLVNQGPITIILETP